MQKSSNIQKANKIVSKAVEVTNELNKMNCIREANWEVSYFDQDNFEIEIKVDSNGILVHSNFAPVIREFYKEYNLKNKIRFGFTSEAVLVLKLGDF